MAQTLELSTLDKFEASGGVLVLFANKGPLLGAEALSIWGETSLDFLRLSEATKFTGQPGKILDVPAPAGLNVDRLLVVADLAAEGDEPIGDIARQNQGGTLFARLSALKAEKITVVVPNETTSAAGVAQLAAGMKLRNYKFDQYKTKSKAVDDSDAEAALHVAFVVADKSATDAEMTKSLAIAGGTILARDLVNQPPNVLGPVEFAARASELSEIGVDVEILEPKKLEELGMGALLAVAQGSVRPARVAIMRWNGGKKDEAPVALVGKGVVFDTGGISIKPAGGMEDMKGDMGGAAAVVGAMKAIASRKAKSNVVGIIGLVENMPDGNAYRPGDIITSMSGQTIEVVNTDAEGRLVLADILWYTQEHLKPKLMINLATLTGAILVGLGQDYAGLFSNDDELTADLTAAGLSTGEKLWRLPLGPAYDKLIESRFADMKNTGGRFGGSITAAQFLKRFANDVPWAHLDIAGTAFNSPASDVSAGWASGFGAALLDRFVQDTTEK